MAGPDPESVPQVSDNVPSPSSTSPLEPIDLWNELPELGARVRDALRSYASNTQLGLRADRRRWKTLCATQDSMRSAFLATVDDLIAFALACSRTAEVDERGVAQMSE